MTTSVTSAGCAASPTVPASWRADNYGRGALSVEWLSLASEIAGPSLREVLRGDLWNGLSDAATHGLGERAGAAAAARHWDPKRLRPGYHLGGYFEAVRVYTGRAPNPTRDTPAADDVRTWLHRFDYAASVLSAVAAGVPHLSPFVAGAAAR